MDRYFSREQAIAEQRPFYIQREEYFNLNSAEYTKGKLEENIAYSRYGWWGIREEAHKAVHLVDCIEAGRLFAYSEKSKNVRNKIEIREYNLGDIINHGGKFMVKVPSRTRNRRYGVTLESVPVGNNDTQYANVYDLRFKHSCEMLEAGFSYRYRPREDVFCPHVMAAYAKIVQSTWGDKLKKTAKLNPFAVPSQMTVNFYHNMDNNVLVKIPRRPVRRLNKAEKEILLWDFVKKYGNPRTGPNKTFYASGRKLQEYNW